MRSSGFFPLKIKKYQKPFFVYVSKKTNIGEARNLADVI